MATLVCPVCGTENPATRLFCRKCAADLHAPAPDPNAPVAAPPEPVPMGPLVIGGGIALVVIALAIGLIVILSGSPAGSPSSSLTPTADATGAPSPSPTAAPTTEPSIQPTIVPPPAETTSPSSAPGKPIVDTFNGPRRASCTGTNGTETPGYIHLSWTASNTTGVRLSIDPPAPNNAYDYGYDDYPAEGSADLPFTCDPPNSDANGAFHLYVATTIHENGRFAYRFIRVYVRD